jgi:hypothetical protein
MSRGLGGHSPSNVQHFLEGVHYPADKALLIDAAQKNDAPSEIIDIIRAFVDNEFGGPQDVMKAYGQLSPEDKNPGGSSDTDDEEEDDE